MPHKSLLALFATILLVLGGCGSIEKDKKANALDQTLNIYGDAIRWGYFETANSYVHPDKRRGKAQDLANIRVTGYEVLRDPLMVDDEKAEQVAHIEYVLKDVQHVHSLSDRQLWSYDKEKNTWWLESGVPQFK